MTWSFQLELTDPRELFQSSYICAGGVEPGDCNADAAMARLSEGSDRNFVPLDEIPAHVKEAVIAAEDRSFYDHNGISVKGIARAALQSVTGGGGSTQGGSTITQQYVKNAFLTMDRTYDRKLREAVLSMKLERAWSKDQILEAYLNTIWWGRQSNGIQAASRAYFDKPVQDINLAEAAYLAGQIRSPASGDYTEHPEEAERRREVVLAAMLEEGYITQEEHDRALGNDFSSVVEFGGAATMRIYKGREAGTAYVTEYVRNELEAMGYTEEEILGGGLRVYTTLDLEMQQAAYETMYHPESGFLGQPGDPSGSIVTLDDQGRIRAMVGGRNFYGDGATAQINFALSERQVGSTFKPLAVAAMVQDGYSLTQSTYDAPGEMTLPEVAGSGCAEWEVHNYDNEDKGWIDLVQATQGSVNTAFAQLMRDLTPARVLEMADDLGMDASELESCESTVLGTGSSSVLEMAEVYSVFANRGMHYEPTMITRVERVDAEGNVELDWEWSAEENSNRVMTEEKSDIVTYSLEQVVQSGTGTAAQVEGIDAAGKTGTTSDYKDAWFVGYTPGLTTAVWMGWPEASWVDPECVPVLEAEGKTREEAENGCRKIPSMQPEPDGFPVRGYESSNIGGGTIPAPIWGEYMRRVVEMRGLSGEFTEPTPEQLAEGETLGRERGQGDDGGGRGPGDTTTTTAPGGGPHPTVPDITFDPCVENPNRPDCDPCLINPTDPRCGGDTTTTTPTTAPTTTSSTTSTTSPDSECPIWDPECDEPPGNGNGGGG